MRKFDGVTVNDDIRLGRRRMRVTRLPRCLCLHMKRFTKNNFFMEKNPTIVNFPVKNLELRDIIPLPEGERGRKGGQWKGRGWQAYHQAQLLRPWVWDHAARMEAQGLPK